MNSEVASTVVVDLSELQAKDEQEVKGLNPVSWSN